MSANRYMFEAERYWGLIDRQLAKGRDMLGDEYTLLDMAVWGWGWADRSFSVTTLWRELPQVKRLLDEINARPAAARVNELAKRYTFKTEMDEEAKGDMFPQNKRLSAA